ncbi:MAG: anion permease [Acidobacteria bacterium]|nr:anion permease [Acidobacteriota bacterium]
MPAAPRLAGVRLAGVVVGLSACVLLWFGPFGFPPALQRSLAISALMIVFWITGPIELYLTGLIGCYLFWALRVTDFPTAFAGFARETPWFLLGAFLLGMTATKTGLALRLGYIILSRVGASYSRILLGMILVDFCLTFLVPSGIARIYILASIATGLMHAFEAERKSNIGRGMFLILTYSATVFDKMIIAGAVSILARGIIVDVGRVPVYWSQWAIACLPGDLVTIVTCWGLTLWLFPPEKRSLPGDVDYLRSELRRMGPLSADERRNAMLMAGAVLLWSTDFLHHLSPPVVGIGAGLAACLPAIGVLNRDDFRKVNFPILIFMGTVLSMGAVLTKTGALARLSETLFAGMAPYLQDTVPATAALYAGTFIYHLFVGEDTVVVGTLMPMVLDFARAHGMNPLPVGIIATIASSGKLFVYQSGVLVAGYAFGYFEAKDLVKVGVVMTIVEALVLLALVPWYWPLVGLRLR